MTIEPATQSELPELHALLGEALVNDPVSIDAVDEKLFRNPCPRRYVYRVWVVRDGTRLAGLIQSVHRREDLRGWVGLFAVAQNARRQGVATELWRHVEADLHADGVCEIEVLAIPANYLTPGLDPRYTQALCFVEACGFERFKDCVNLTAPLDRPFETGPEESRLADQGIVIRRAAASDDAILDAYFGEQFGADWRLEAALAMNNYPPGLHLAIADDRIIAFSAHSTQNCQQGFFGPMGTSPEARGKGIGRVLLHRCLRDLRDAGHASAIIPWVGPISFYARHADCRVDRVFWRYRTRIGGSTA